MISDNHNKYAFFTQQCTPDEHTEFEQSKEQLEGMLPKRNCNV